MTRTIQDEDLLLWEAYATAGDFGFPDRARLVFHCLTDPSRRARYVEREGDKSDVENEVGTLSDGALLSLLGEARELS
jgi:hypothetical protein